METRDKFLLLIAAFDAAVEDMSPNIPWAQVQKDLELT